MRVPLHKKLHYPPPNCPKADSMAWYKCDECEHLHVAMLDEQERIICVGIADLEMVQAMLLTAMKNGIPS